MSGSATLTTVMSSSNMNVAVQTAISVHHLRSSTDTADLPLSGRSAVTGSVVRVRPIRDHVTMQYVQNLNRGQPATPLACQDPDPQRRPHPVMGGQDERLFSTLDADGDMSLAAATPIAGHPSTPAVGRLDQLVQLLAQPFDVNPRQLNPLVGATFAPH